MPKSLEGKKLPTLAAYAELERKVESLTGQRDIAIRQVKDAEESFRTAHNARVVVEAANKELNVQFLAMNDRIVVLTHELDTMRAKVSSTLVIWLGK